MNNKNNENHIYYKRIYDCFEDEYTFNAKGINIDYMLALNYSAEKNDISIKEITIDSLFKDILGRVKAFHKKDDFNNNPFEVINFIMKQEIMNVSQELSTNYNNTHFNYCVKFSDRNQPEVRVSIPFAIENIKKRIERLVQDRRDGRVYTQCVNAVNKPVHENFKQENSYRQALSDYENSLIESSENLRKELINFLNQDFCVYIALWIHAYRLERTINKASEDKRHILFSHSYKGWSQPSYRFTKDLELQIATNFGYGRSSYFRLIIVYKNIKLINFIEWIDYKVKGASVIKSYTRKYEGFESSAGVSNRFINNSNWIEAINDTKQICETYLMNEKEFINEFIYKSLDSMVNELDKIFEVNILDKQFNKEHRLFDDTLESLELKKTVSNSSAISVVVMSVKGEKITGALDLISNIMQLDSFFSVDEHITRIRKLNERLLPLMKNELKTIPEAKSNFEETLAVLYIELNKLRELSKSDEECQHTLDSITEMKNNIDILKKCEKNIYQYLKVIERFETGN